MNNTQKFFLIAFFVNGFYLVLTFIFFYFLDSFLMSADNNDFLTFYNAGNIVITDLPNLYDASLYLFPFRYFPLAAYFFTPFSVLGVELGYFVFQIFNFFLNFLNIYLMFKIIQVYKKISSNVNIDYSLNNFKDIFYKIENKSVLHQNALFLIMLPQFMNYFLGQINILVCFFVLASLFYFLNGGNRNNFLGGCLLGLGILIKPTLILILPFILLISYNRASKKLTFHFKQSVIRLCGPIILIGFSGIFFIVYPEMLNGFIEVNLAGKYTYQVGGDLEINPSFSLTRVILIVFDLVNLDVNNILVFSIIILISFLPLYLLFISSTDNTNKLIYGYLSAITITLLVYFDSWPHHIVVLAPFLIFFLLLNKNFRLYAFFKYLHYLFAILLVAFWGIFYLTYQIVPFNIGGLILIILLYYTLITFYRQR
ncbi:MAG: glycosyltransferase 87 family protein [Candidatus Thorarchaeota archaeon]